MSSSPDNKDNKVGEEVGLLEEACDAVNSLCVNTMQGIQDIVTSTANFIVPVVKGVVDAILPPSSSKDNNNKDCNKTNGNGKSSKSPKNGNGGNVVVSFNRNLIRVAGLSGALAVGLGAYGAHVIMINDKIPDNQKHSFKTANMYHFVGTFGLVAASMASYPKVSGTLMAVGSTIFCGSCYYFGFTGDTSLNKYAPVGGSTLILAWLSLVL